VTEPDGFRANIYRLVFALAAAEGVALAIWLIAWPEAFCELFGIDSDRYAAAFQSLAIAMAVAALGYAWASWRLDRALPIIATGLLGKTVVPIGWVAMVQAGWLPVRSFTFILFADLVWWLPFGLFLLEPTRTGMRLRAWAPYLCASLNFMAAVAMPLMLLPGLETTRDPVLRLRYVAAHPVVWRTGWCLWILAALSLFLFYGWWAARVHSRFLGMAALILAIAGMSGDLLAETLYIGWLPAGDDRVETVARLLTGAWGNTLYTLAGMLLTLGSPWLRGPARVCAWLIWAAGLALGWFSITGNATGMAASTALIFILFCPWVAWIGILDRRRFL